MAIKKLFDATWEQVFRGASGYGDSDILPDQRVIIVNRNVKKWVWGQLIMMFDKEGNMELVTSRFRATPLAVPAYLHLLGQARPLYEDGIKCNIAFERGLVTCTYSKIGWISSLMRGEVNT